MSTTLCTAFPSLSPRVRGNRPMFRRCCRRTMVYPRVCGGTAGWAGTITRDRVYPRVCGGTGGANLASLMTLGLSPRVRGNLSRLGGPCQYPRSIPACAGEPADGVCLLPRRHVYPRVCGGTRTVARSQSGHCGLSPRVRGNRAGVLLQTGQRGSIPACAGEPRGCPPIRWPIAVYPRVCGGTAIRLPRAPPLAGLSPRVRGNRHLMSRPGAWERSIPACAGEPTTTRRGQNDYQVYPRVCGGTVI